MPIVRRAFAAFLSILLLHLVVGSGTVRAPRHQVDVAHHTAPAADNKAPMDPSHCNGSGRHEDCRLPVTPGACLSMSTCRVNAAPAVVAFASASVRPAPMQTSPAKLAHVNPTFSPELPPPRA